jgi:nucleotide-binding universal stress UspA family protein
LTPNDKEGEVAVTINTILAPLYDDALDTIVLDAAAKLAVKFGAHLETLLMRASIDVTEGLISDRIDARHYRPLLDALAHQIARDERVKKEKFEKVVSDAGIVFSNEPSMTNKPSASWRVNTDDPAEVLARYGGAFDLIIAGHPSLSAETSKSSHILDAAVFNTARPVLLTSKEITPTVGEVILLAWNRGIPAGRALICAHPFMEKAKRVVILTIMTGAKQGPEPEDIAKNLAWHNISAEVKRVPPSSRSVAEIIAHEAQAIHADLLVMGAYSQSRIRERVLGGVTTAIMSRAQLPVLMAR